MTENLANLIAKAISDLDAQQVQSFEKTLRETLPAYVLTVRELALKKSFDKRRYIRSKNNDTKNKES